MSFKKILVHIFVLYNEYIKQVYLQMEKDIMAELGMLSDDDEDSDKEDEDQDEDEQNDEDEDVLEDIMDKTAIEELRKEVEASVNLVESNSSNPEPDIPNLVPEIPNLTSDIPNLAPVRGSEGEDEEEDDQIEDLKDFNSRYKPFRDGQPRVRQASTGR